VTRSRCEGDALFLTADGYLVVDGLVIYRMEGFTLATRPAKRLVA